MRLTVDLDDDLLAKARELTGIDDVAVLLTAALKALVDRETRRRSEPE